MNTVPANALTPAYIYPLHADYREDVLNFFLYPDAGEINLGSGGGSAPHPSYGHSVKQMTGRLSPTFSFSLMFEGISPPTRYGATSSGLESRHMLENELPKLDRYGTGTPLVAQAAFDWFMRNVGPDDTRQLKDEAQLFVLKLWGSGSRIVSLDRVKLTPMIMSRSTGYENLVRRFRADLSGEYVYPVKIDISMFKKKGKRRGKGPAKPAQKQAPATATKPAAPAAPTPRDAAVAAFTGAAATSALHTAAGAAVVPSDSAGNYKGGANVVEDLSREVTEKREAVSREKKAAASYWAARNTAAENAGNDIKWQKRADAAEAAYEAQVANATTEALIRLGKSVTPQGMSRVQSYDRDVDLSEQANRNRNLGFLNPNDTPTPFLGAHVVSGSTARKAGGL